MCRLLVKIQIVPVVLITRKVFVIKKKNEKEKTKANNEIYSHENALMVWYKKHKNKKKEKLCKNQMKIVRTIRRKMNEQ